METQTPSETSQTEFLPGTAVIYAMHGKCQIIGTEVRQLSGKAIRFYKLEIKKSALSRSNRLEPAIWVPVETAKEQGLRLPMTREDADNVMKTLLSREYFFKLNNTWTTTLTELENCIRFEGGIGLAKVASFLYVLKKKQIVPTPEVLKLQESIHKLLFKELGEALGEAPKILEEKTLKGMRCKLLPDN